MDIEDLIAARLRTLDRLGRATMHEARGAASGIVVHAELVAGALDADGDAAQRAQRRRWVERLRAEQARLLAVAETFVSHASVPALTAAPFDPGAMVDGLATLVRPFARERQMRLAVERPDRPRRVVGPRDVVAQVLLDALMGALEPGTAGGGITLTAGGDGTVTLRSTSPVGAPCAAWTEVLAAAGATIDRADATLTIGLPIAPEPARG
jgi:signal transduction histidine kinase